jgi:omega-6 fatty acid desaturase (delta-12 desaturase)
LNDLVGDAAIVEPFSIRWLRETLRSCRLYDYETHRWLDFDGRPTYPAVAPSRQRSAMLGYGADTMFTPGT